MATETLKGVAEREAAEAEAEFEAGAVPPESEDEAGTSGTDGSASDGSEQRDSEDEGGTSSSGPTPEEIEGLGVEPGEQGSATSEPELDTGGYEPPDRDELTQEDLKLADELVSELRTRAQELSAEQVVDKLVRVVDIHPSFLTPMSWPGADDETYRGAPIVGEIAGLLCRGCPHIEIHYRDLIPLWKNADSWKSRGRVIRSKEKSLSKFDRFLSDGAKATVIVNYQLFKTMNPLQKVFTVYQALRRLDRDGKTIPPHFEGFADELWIFGSRVFRELVTLKTAVEKASEREDRLEQYQLSLLESDS